MAPDLRLYVDEWRRVQEDPLDAWRATPEGNIGPTGIGNWENEWMTSEIM